MKKLILIIAAAITLLASCGKTTTIKIHNDREDITGKKGAEMTDMDGSKYIPISQDNGDIFDITIHGYVGDDLIVVHKCGDIKKGEVSASIELDERCEKVKISYIFNNKMTVYYSEFDLYIKDFFTLDENEKETAFFKTKGSKVNKIHIKE